MNCNICDSSSYEVIYENLNNNSITSLNKIIDDVTIVRTCHSCKHIYTQPVKNIEQYYDTEYNILTKSKEEDHLYIAKDGSKHFRLEYQAHIFNSKIPITNKSHVLDYGCAKAQTLRLMTEANKNIIPLCFDISSTYLSFWESFVEEHHCFANKVVDKKFNNNIDLVTSFFSLEHANSPTDFMQDIHRLLKPKGKFFCVMPHVFNNSADLVVADHVNHFTINSIQYLMHQTGFELTEIDEDIYHGAYVIVAEKKERTQLVSKYIHYSDPNFNQIYKISDYWNQFSTQIETIKKQIYDTSFMIYGGGFYGRYIASLIGKPPKFFIDQNPYLSGVQFLGAKTIPLEKVPSNILNIIVGLNPATAKTIIARDVIKLLPSHRFIYLD